MNKEKNQTGTKSLLGKPVSIRDYEPPKKWIATLRDWLSNGQDEDDEQTYSNE